MVVRELTGDVYFGQPKGIDVIDGERVGYNNMIYKESEIRRIAKVAFEVASKRSKKICSVDKANVLDVSQLWRDVVHEEVSPIHIYIYIYIYTFFYSIYKSTNTPAPPPPPARSARPQNKNYPDIEVTDMYVDNAAMQLIRAPTQFDVILTGNIFGDILSDEASMLVGSLGMLPSASISGDGPGVFEPCHGSAPDIAGEDKANPLAMILSAAMMLKYDLDRPKEAQLLEDAVEKTLEAGWRTGDIMQEGGKPVGCKEMGQRVSEELAKLMK
ncbi:hypothetical protein TL16_g01949 [Triparma laevis f. inornata]|uniref:3-isopropylmalate dehydrogenase n=1 Tax=Triparma laevis f. inornata TaxID=1714386 RepID=A0A9W6ZME6_9STRA|nr:hypothetical protein TL16_g01949 [Triparma laevis f. inornata]